MKKVFSILLGIMVAAAVASVEPITWSATHLDLGSIRANESVLLSFEFTNNSQKPLMIVSAKGTCGCTSVEYPKTAVSPGETAAIQASFKSGKTGMFNKSITLVTSLTDEPVKLTFSGEVVQ